MGLAIVGCAAAGGGDSIDGGCAAAAPARDRDTVRSLVRRPRRLQLRRRRPAPRRAAVLAAHARTSALSRIRLLPPERRRAVDAGIATQIPAAHPRRPTSGRGPSLPAARTPAWAKSEW